MVVAETAAALRKAVELAARPPDFEQVEAVGAGWVAEECPAIAVYCALQATRSGKPRAALLLSVNQAGDSDSPGAVTGNLLGAAYGLSGLPMDWVGVVEGRDVLVQMADDPVLNFGLGDRAALAGRYPVDQPH